MALTKKRYATLNKFLYKARAKFPEVAFNAYRASKEINEIYGEGFILVGKRGIYEKEFFILFEDPRRMAWAAMINGELESEVKNAHGSR